MSYLRLARYNGRASALTLKKRPSSCTALAKLAYHSAKIATLSPLSEAKDQSSSDDPLADMGVPSALTTVQYRHNKFHQDLRLELLPSLPPNFTNNSLPLLNKKIELCFNLCDFTDPEGDIKAKSIKLQTLKELLNIFDSPTNIKKVSSETIDLFFEMITINLKRGIPSVPQIFLFGSDEPLLIDISWPHLSYVYSLLLKYQSLCPTDSHFDEKFCQLMISLLSAPDPNERENIYNFFIAYLKAFPDREPQIFKEFSYILDEYRYGSSNAPFAIRPILRVFIERFKSPENAAIKGTIFFESIVPLSSCHHFQSIFDLLQSVFEVVIEHNPEMIPDLILNHIKHWPEAYPSKEIIALQFLDFLVAKLPQEYFEEMSEVIFRRYAKSHMNNHHKVVAFSVNVYQNVDIIPKIIDNSKIIFPIVYVPLVLTMNGHWNRSAQDKAMNAIRSLIEIDPLTIDELKKINSNEPIFAEKQELHRSWALIARQAAKQDKSIDLAPILAEMQKRFNKNSTSYFQSKNGNAMIRRHMSVQ